MLWLPDVSVKHSSQTIPETPFSVSVLVLLPGHVFVSGYLLAKNLSTVSLFCWAVWGGLDVPLPMVMEPLPSGLVTVMLWSSLFATVQPVGRLKATPVFDTVPP